MPAAFGSIFRVIPDPFQMDCDARSRRNGPLVVSHRLGNRIAMAVTTRGFGVFLEILRMGLCQMYLEQIVNLERFTFRLSEEEMTGS